MDVLLSLLAQPWLAAILGALVGLGALALTAFGVRQFTPETLEIGAARAVVLLVLGLVLAFVGLLLYFLFVRAGLVAFGLGLIAGFLIPALIVLFRSSGIAKASTVRR